MARRGSPGLQGFFLQIDIAEIVLHKTDQPDAVVDFFDANGLPRKGHAEQGDFFEALDIGARDVVELVDDGVDGVGDIAGGGGVEDAGGIGGEGTNLLWATPFCHYQANASIAAKHARIAVFDGLVRSYHPGRESLQLDSLYAASKEVDA